MAWKTVMRAGLLAGAVSACTATGETPPEAPAPPEATCEADAVRFALGEPYSRQLADQALRESGARTLRKIEPGMGYTMDFRADRLNIEVDRRDRVTNVRCG